MWVVAAKARVEGCGRIRTCPPPPTARLCPWGPLGLASRLPRAAPASLTLAHLSLRTQPVGPTVDGGAQVQQAVNIECLSDFAEAPVLSVQFRWAWGRRPRLPDCPLLPRVWLAGAAGSLWGRGREGA